MESDLSRIVRRVINEETKPVKQFQKGEYQGFKTESYTATGEDLFKQGQDQIDTNNFDIKNLAQKIQDAVTKSAPGRITVTVNGGASNTSWSGKPAGSPEAIKKNKELATSRRNNLVSYFKNKISSPFVTYVLGNATVGKLNPTDPEKDQFVSILVKGDAADGKVLVDRDNTSIQYPNNYKNQLGVGGTESRICTKVPTVYASDLKKVISDWGKSKGLKLPISDKTV